MARLVRLVHSIFSIVLISSNGEMFRVIARISDGSLYNRWSTISSFYR